VLPLRQRAAEPWADAAATPDPSGTSGGRPLQAGPYRLERQLGGGGESLVWLGAHVSAATSAVLKIQRSEVRAERMRREVAVLYALQEVRTPNVVRLLPAGEDGQLHAEPGAMYNWSGDEVLYCAIELLPCDSDRNLIKQLPLKRRDVVEVCDALRAALRVMHVDFEMIHNDLKPDNVAAWRDGRDGPLHVRLFDFGQAALLTPQPQTRYPCVTPEPWLRYVYDYGTWAYLAPERWRGQTADGSGVPAPGGALVDDRTDQWSFAAMTFEFITGRRLVNTQSKEQFKQAIVGGAYRAAVDEARLPGGAKAALKRALALDPAERYQRISSLSGLDFFCRDLEAALT
jgi:serine/threonine-protein kinase